MASKQPQDRQAKAPTKAQQKTEEQKRKEQNRRLRELMDTQLDFSPFTIDAGDGVEWSFNPDPMPSETESLQRAMRAVDENQKQVKAGETPDKSLTEVFDELTEATREYLLEEKQKKAWPKGGHGRNYGLQALMWFAMHLATGRDGLPLDED